MSTNHEYEYYTEILHYEISVSKVGGGTVGRAYEGSWEYLVTTANGSIVVKVGDDLYTGTPKTHHEAAVILAEFLAAIQEEKE